MKTRWRFNGFNVVDDKEKAVLHGRSEAELIENLTLAAAAPELLALLSRFYDATYGKTELIPALDFEQARAAIDKAEGK